MDPQARGRSPSVGNQSPHIRNSPSPNHFNAQVAPENTPNPNFSHGFVGTDVSPTNTANLNFNYVNAAHQQPQQFQQPLQDYDQFAQNGLNVPQLDPADQQFQPDMLNVETRFGAFPHQQGFAKQELLLDPQLQAGGQFPDQPLNPNGLVSNMSSPQNLVPTPPNHQMRSQHSEPNSPYSQGPSPQQRYSPSHSHNASLDPAAAYANGQAQDWTGIMQGPQFQGHRRTPSEFSDVSSSNAPSPYLNQGETFDHIEQHHSPLLNPQPDPQSYNDGLGIESVNISEPHQRPSPQHSPFVSPRLSPQPGLGSAQDAQLMGLQETRNGYGGALIPETYGAPTERFPMVQPEQRLGSNDFGRADQYDVPQINVDPAPMQQSALDQARSPTDIDALSPPERGRRRGRAKSDTHIPRAGTPSSTQVNLGSPDSSTPVRGSSLSPFDASYSPHGSRSPSPVPRSPSARRSSTSSIPNRDYILELADPNRPPASGNEKGRVQKHPATFSCHLCPKKFTRAYNLRSHLRTHTDERPFVCTVCSKAFARQHDRKRHEGLHSGEKKFVCRGELGTGAQWGCGRRFARADALGRHFRSEAGRVCIKPLLDEEAEERQRMDDNMMAQRMGGGLAPSPGMNGMPIQQPFAFPAALLQQFPALQGIQWDNMAAAGPDEDDFSGRSSFDASSGGDFYDDDDGTAGGYMSDNPMGAGFQQHGWQHDHGWKSDIEP